MGTDETTRRERRRQARVAKKKKKFDSWLHNQQSHKLPNSDDEHDSKDNAVPQTSLKDSRANRVDEDEVKEKPRAIVKSKNIKTVSQRLKKCKNNLKAQNKVKVSRASNEEIAKKPRAMVELENMKKVSKAQKGFKKLRKSKFFEYLDMETGRSSSTADDDLRMEKRLAKKLKLKSGKLGGFEDDLDALLAGIPSVLDDVEEKGVGDDLYMKSKKRKTVAEDMNVEDDEELEDENGSSGSGDELDDEISSDESDGNMEEDVGDEVDEESEDRISYDDVEDLDDHITADEVSEDSDDEVSIDKIYEKSGSLTASSEKNVDSMNQSKVLNQRERKKKDFSDMGTNDSKSLAKASSSSARKRGREVKEKDINMSEGDLPELDSSEDEPVKNRVDNPKQIKKSKLNEQEEKNMMELSLTNGEIPPSEKVLEKSSNTAPTKYVAPHLRSGGGTESAEHAQVRKRVRGLLNRLSESNVESITGQISTLYQSVGRAVGSQIICEEVVASCSGGPRGNEQYAAVFAAFVAGLACSVGIDFGAKLLARVAECFEEEYLKEDNLSLRNLTLLLSYLYVFGVCSSDLINDFLIMLGKRLTEVDVSTVLTVLNCCGMKLRSDDPTSMKNFIASVQSSVSEWRASSGNKQSNINNKRLEFMLETICDIKNNKKRHKDDTVQHTRIKKWLQKLRADNILIRGLKWSKLIDPTKKGQWWLSGDMASTAPSIDEVADTIDKEIPETKKMIELAASQRMNTDARRAIFCVIMSGEDYIDAFEKLLRLDLSGKQDREIMRVLVDCCLQEKVFNKYYCVLASKLCSHYKNHKFTLQYCIWDHYKELESMSLIRSMHLSKFTAEMVSSFSLSLAVLKVVDFYDVLELSPKKIMHFRMLFESIFESSDKLVWNVFSRIALVPEYESLRSGIDYFIKKHVFVGDQKTRASKLKIARKALNNVEGVVL